jgi:hypothetical protein
VLRPDVVLFGEEIPALPGWTAKRAPRDCDLFIAISAAASKPESSRASTVALGPAALRRCASGTMRRRSSSVCLAACCVPGRSTRSRHKPCEPRYAASGQ